MLPSCIFTYQLVEKTFITMSDNSLIGSNRFEIGVLKSERLSNQSVLTVYPVYSVV